MRDGFYVNGETFNPAVARARAARYRDTEIDACECGILHSTRAFPLGFILQVFFSPAKFVSANSRERAFNQIPLLSEYSVDGKLRELTLMDMWEKERSIM